MLDKRKVFDTIPELFDKWRVRYSQELFDYIISETQLDKTKRCLEIGPGTGQATDFALKTGCDYCAIELGEHLTEYMTEKYKKYWNFHIVNTDFEKHAFEANTYDLVYSASAIQWITEEIAFSKCYEMLKKGGYLAMFLTKGDYKSTNIDLYQDIQKVYDAYFVTDAPYKQKFHYTNATEYGFESIERKEFYGTRVFTADEYVEYIGTHSDHIMIKQEYKEQFYNGIYEAIMKHGGKIEFKDTFVLYLCKK